MKSYPKAIVVQAGNRDRYQVPLAMNEAGLLQRFVTDAYWSPDESWSKLLINSGMPKRIFSARNCAGISKSLVRLSKKSFCATVLNQLLGSRSLNSLKDKALSRTVRRVGLAEKAEAVFSYSHYASASFAGQPAPFKHRFLFQYHPHPQSVRNILLEESKLVPFARESLMREHEFSLGADEFNDLAREPMLANGWVAASSYTACTLYENGVPPGRVHVVPYGVDTVNYPERQYASSPEGKPFTVVFVGTLSQRKGLSYLLDAARLLKSQNIRIVLCGRGQIDHNLMSHYADVNPEVKINLTNEQLVHQLHQSDVFVLPSLVEGFAHVILEAMSCGLPVITTTNTCAPDVMTDGDNGFIVPIRDAGAIAGKLSWGLENRRDLQSMGRAAAQQARGYTWERFRHGIRDAYRRMIDHSRESAQK
jgi:glycosyltransferase involved in cell wall biosynthesis